MQIWSDASYLERKAGLGVLIRKLSEYGTEEIRLSKAVRCEDNNLAELQAVIYGLENLGARDRTPILIVTDSQFCIDSLKFPSRWDGKRREYAEKALNLIGNHKWGIYHKKGHCASNNIYSERQCISDKLARNSLGEVGYEHKEIKPLLVPFLKKERVA